MICWRRFFFNNFLYFDLGEYSGPLGYAIAVQTTRTKPKEPGIQPRQRFHPFLSRRHPRRVPSRAPDPTRARQALRTRARVFAPPYPFLSALLSPPSCAPGW
jgi:hypothetical protein